MKTAMIVGLLASSLLAVANVSAMEMMDSGAMMQHDTMTGVTMISHTMTPADHMMMAKNMSTVAVANSMGYSWAKDRKSLAMKAGVTNYTGTAKQNLVIRTYLFQMMKDGKMMKDDAMMKKDDAMMKHDTMQK